MTNLRYLTELGDVKSVYNADIESNVQVILDLAQNTWSTFTWDADLSKDELARLGEICRRAAIVCVASGRSEAPIWRSRSLAMFTLAQSSNGVAMLVLMAACQSLSGGDANGALSQLGLMAHLTSADDAVISAELVRSAMLENTAIVHIFQEDWASARRALSAVVELEVASGDFRRLQKAKASLTTVEYHDGDPDIAIADLARIVEECDLKGGAGSVRSIASENLDAMRRRERSLRPYQV
jgi:hypothetical protein